MLFNFVFIIVAGNFPVVQVILKVFEKSDDDFSRAKKKETTHEKKIPCVLIPLSVSWPAFGPQSGELPLYQDENMRQKTNSLLTVRVSWWAFWS